MIMHQLIAVAALLSAPLCMAGSYVPFTPEPPVIIDKCGAKTLDVLIALDDSASISAENWPVMVDFTESLMTRMNESFSFPQLGHLVFGGKKSEDDREAVCQVLQPLAVLGESHFDSISEFDHCVINCGTPTDGAFSTGKAEIDARGRPNVAKVFVLITDGEPTICYNVDPAYRLGYPCNRSRTDNQYDAFEETTSFANVMKEEGTLVMTVGVALPQKHAAFMRSTASIPTDIFALTDIDFESLSASVETLVDLMCFYTDKIYTNSVREECSDKTDNVIQIEGNNLIDMGNLKCKFSAPTVRSNGKVAVAVNIVDAVLVNSADLGLTSQADSYDLVQCAHGFTYTPPDDKNFVDVIVEVTRDGFSYTENSRSFIWQDDCAVTTRSPTQSPTPAPTPSPTVEEKPEISSGCSSTVQDYVYSHPGTFAGGVEQENSRRQACADICDADDKCRGFSQNFETKECMTFEDVSDLEGKAGFDGFARCGGFVEPTETVEGEDDSTVEGEDDEMVDGETEDNSGMDGDDSDSTEEGDNTTEEGDADSTADSDNTGNGDNAGDNADNSDIDEAVSGASMLSVATGACALVFGALVVAL